MTLPDEAWQLAVLSRVLVLHPERLSVAELRREMLAGEQEFAQTDAHGRAVRDLTRAAVCFAALHR